MIFIFLCAIWIHFIPFSTDAACTYPSALTGTWLSSDKGSLSFTSTTLSNYPTTKFGPLDFSCDNSSGDYYVGKSPSFSYFGVDFEAYLCLRFTSYATYVFTYYLGSTKDPDAYNERFKSAATGSALTVTEVCDRTTYVPGQYSVLIREGYASSAAVDCPDTLQSTFTYSFNDGTSTYCSTNSSLDVCTDKSELVFDYAKCSQQVLYSAGGSLSCLYSVTSGSITYVSLYNNDQTVDGSSTYRLICLAVTESDTTRNVTQYPVECTTAGGSLILTVEASCPTPSPEEVSSAVIALAVLVPLVLIVVTLIVCYFCLKKHQKKQDKAAAAPDPKYANGEIANKKLCPYHDGVTFTADANDNLIKREDSVISTGIGIRREESIVVSLPSSSRGGKRPRTEESIFEEPENSVIEEPGSDDERYEVRDITELIPSVRISVPKITISEATTESICSEPVVITEEDNKKDKKKLKVKRKKSGKKVRFKRSVARRKSAKVRNAPTEATQDLVSSGQEKAQEDRPETHVETVAPTKETTSETTVKTIDEMDQVKSVVKTPARKRPSSVKSTASRDEHQERTGMDSLSYGTKTLVLKLKQRNPSAKKKKVVEGENKTDAEIENKRVTSIEVKTNDDVAIEMDSPEHHSTEPPLDNSQISEPDSNMEGIIDDSNYVNVNVQPVYEEPLTERLEDDYNKDNNYNKDDKMDEFDYELNGPYSAQGRRVSTLREEAYKLRPISEQTQKRRGTGDRRKTMPILNTNRYVKQATTPEERIKISKAWSRSKSAKKGKVQNKDDQPVRGMDFDLEREISGVDDESVPDGDVRRRAPPKPFIQPRADTPDDVWKKISSLWHLGFQWLGNTPLGTKPPNETI